MKPPCASKVCRRATVTLLLAFLAAPPLFAQKKPELPPFDRIRLAEAFRLARFAQDRIWKGWSGAPFAVLLVTPEYEYLVRHPQPTSDFVPAGYDALLRSEVYYRKRKFASNLLATFPAVNGLPTIVVGEAENTMSKTSTPWVLTLLHEHFHQWQESQPDYNSGVASLNLARGDQTGMWMLNYSFPYDSAEVQQRFTHLCQALSAALGSIGREDLPAKLAEYEETQRRFQEGLSPDDYKYFSFQLWQEGVARYTELRVAQFAAAKYHASRAFRDLPDFTSFPQAAEGIRRNIEDGLGKSPLGSWKRVAFYSVGAAEAMLLDRASPGWHDLYFKEKFFLEKYFSDGSR